jgi:hypothetical protein
MELEVIQPNHAAEGTLHLPVHVPLTVTLRLEKGPLFAHADSFAEARLFADLLCC